MEFTLLTALLLIGIGIAAGVAAGFVGIGGGIIMVPVLLELFRAWQVPPESLVQAAMATSLTVATFSVASSALRHHRQGNVLWSLVPLIFPSSMAGGWLAALIAGRTDGRWLQIGLAIALLLSAIKMLLESKRPDRPQRHVVWWKWVVVGLGVGMFAGLSGLAGGNVLVPALALIAFIPTKKLAGTSSGVVMFSALAAAIGYMVNGPAESLPSGFIGYSYLPAAACLALTAIPGAQLGAWLNKKAGSLVYKRIFGALLILVVARLLTTT